MNQVTILTILLTLLVLALPAEISAQTLTWDQTSGPLGGSPFSLFVDPVGTVFTASYLATGSSFVFLSTDDGDRWTKVDLPNQYYGSFTANKSGHVFTGAPAAVYRSTNGGVSWQLLSNGLDNTNISALAVNANDTLFAGSSGGKSGIFRSIDNGNSWSQVASGITVYAITIDQDGHIYAGGYYSGVWNSTDGGDTWSPTSLTGATVGTLATTATNEVLAGLYLFGGFGGGVVRTTDGGINWTQIGLAGNGVSSIIVKPATQIFAASQDSGVYRSTDNGTTWIHKGLSAASALAWSPAGQLYAGASSGGSMGGGSAGGVFRSSNDGDSWTKVGLPNTTIPALTIPAAGSSKDVVFAAIDSVVFRSTDKGNAWLRTGLLPHQGLYSLGLQSLFTGSSGSIFAGTMQWGIYRTTDQGTSWAQVGLNGETVYSFLEYPAGRIYASANSFVYVSTDGGSSWSATGGSLPGSWLSSLAKNSSGDIFVGMVNKSDTAYVCRSTDNGQTWMQTTMTSYPVMALVITGGDTILAGCAAFFSGGGVFRSTNNGATWTDVSSGLVNRDIRALIRNSIGHTFAATANGVYRSTNNGDLWEPVSTGLTFPIVQSLALNSNGELFAGTTWGGVLRTIQSTTSVREAGHEMPLSYGLEQNYPNPFNPTTVISYQVSAVSSVRLAVYDLLGREVAVLVNEKKAPGSYEVRFDGSGLASGVYLYRLTAGTFFQARKLLILK